MVRFRVFRMKYTAIMDNTPGNRFTITAAFISGLRAGKRMQEVAYATISTKAVETTHTAHAMMKVFLNQFGNCATLSAEKSRFLYCARLHSFGKKVLVFMPVYALKEVTTSQTIGTSQTNAKNASNRLCNNVLTNLFINGTPPLCHPSGIC